MAILRPFKAVRPSKGYEDKVIAEPYDVMNREEATEMAKENPYSFLHITRSEIDMPVEMSAYDEKVYQKAKVNLHKFMEDGILQEEAKPMLYIYKQTMGDVVQVGIVGCVSVDDYENDIIKKHEFTREAKEKDRINHFDVCNANTEPVFLTYKDNKQVETLINGYMQNNKPEYDLDFAGTKHEFWAIKDDNVINGIVGIFANIPYLYIADGHHRTASGYKVAAKRRKEHPDYEGNEEFNYLMAVLFPDKQLKVMDYNRVVKDLNGLTDEEFIEAIKKAGFEVELKGEDIYRPEEKSVFAMYLGDKWYKITASEKLIPDDVVRSLDACILQENVLDAILDIKDPRNDSRIDFVGGIRGLEELEKRVHDDMKVAFAVYPVEVQDIMNVADQNLVMPPKSTWFEPKLASGLFVHLL